MLQNNKIKFNKENEPSELRGNRAEGSLKKTTKVLKISVNSPSRHSHMDSRRSNC